MKSSEIRQAFIDYFVQQGHQVVASSSLVPQNDPTLLFTNAGMVQFKDVFLGHEARPYQRAVSAQRCVRAGGKHNDLENVGYTARHHTFFEMLGNFSFGDYFKRDAIRMAWYFLTSILKLPAEKLWVTVYLEDDEAADIWLKEVGVSSERFSRCGEQDNFWSMGETGPCGPCTEIFYDHGPEVAGGPPGSPEADGDRYIEIWNLVFMQYNRDAKGVLHPLPKPSVDTGMGLERIAAVVQGVHNNYDIDSFRHIIQAIASMAKEIDSQHASLKVIADHIRACAFLIADGVFPGNEGRGYVLRRIVRRAIRHGYKLGLPSPFFYQLVTPLVEVMGEAYPELIANQSQIERVLSQEEIQFARTLEKGLQLLQEQIEQLTNNILPGEMAFKLYDTYGFPVDLTGDIAREQGLQIDMDAFENCMQQQRLQSQQASQFSVDYSNTNQMTEISHFVGYEKNTTESTVLAILKEGERVNKLLKGEAGVIILDETPFYAESGGQVGDRGQLIKKDSVFTVRDTQRSGEAILHQGEWQGDLLQVGDKIQATVDYHRRDAIRLNHTATHLLHAALKRIVGEHVHQRGSLVDAERARFDFSHFEPLTAEQLIAIESLVNEQICHNHAVETQIMALDEAKKRGAVALFGEKYSEEVRVLSVSDFSKELCGGTHVKRTGDIGLFKVISEYGVASGIRRIEMVTGKYALQWVNEQLTLLSQFAGLLKTTPMQAGEKLAQLQSELRQSEKEITQLQEKLAIQSIDTLLNKAEKIDNAHLLISRVPPMENQALRTLLDQLKSKLDPAMVLLYTLEDNRMQVLAGVSKSLLSRVPPAIELVKALCGKGGGREDMAQGGGPVPSDLESRKNALADQCRSRLKLK